MRRTDDDTWDLSSSVGATATMVAAARALASRESEPLINDPFAEPLVRAVGVDFFSRWAAGELDGVDEQTVVHVRHMADWMASRTKYFDDYLAEAADSGIRQVVILAAGLDSRLYRMDWPAGTTAYEVDQPQVIQFKSAVMTKLGAEAAADRRTVAIDLRQDWQNALQQNGFDATQRTAWLVEGLLRYLPPDAQGTLLDQIDQLSAPASWFGGNAPSGDHGDAERVQSRMHGMVDRWQEHGVEQNLSDLAYPALSAGLDGHLQSLGWEAGLTTSAGIFAAAGMTLPVDSPFGNTVYVRAVKQ